MDVQDTTASAASEGTAASECTSPGALQDVTMDNSYSMGFRSPSMHALPVGSTSPGQGRSLRECEEQITTLRKENFNLKLKIYFLEENRSSQLKDTPETLAKQNVDLKVKNESLQKDLQDKQDLLGQAVKAIEVLEEAQKETEDKSQAHIEDLNHRINFLELEIKAMERDQNNKHNLFSDLLSETEFPAEMESQQRLIDMDDQIKQLEQREDEYKTKTADLEDQLSKREHTICDLQAKINQVLQEKSQDHDVSQVKDQLYELKKEFAEKACELDMVKESLTEKSTEHNKACMVIQKMVSNIKHLERENERLKNNEPSTAGSSKTDETPSLVATQQDDAVAIVLRNQHARAIKEKDSEIAKLAQEVRKKNQSLQTLVNTELWEKNREIERLTRLLNTKKGSARPSSPMNDTIEQLQQSFSESEYMSALEKNKCLKKRVDHLIQKLYTTTTAQSNVTPEASTIIEQLKVEVKEARDEADQAHKWRKQCADVCSVLTVRLEELAGFLESLLKHQNVLSLLGADRRKAMRKAVDRSFDLSRSITNMSLSISNLSMNDQSLMQLSTMSGLLDLSTDNKENKVQNSMIIEEEESKLIEGLRAEIVTLRSELEKSNIKRREVVSSVMKKDRRSLPVKIESNLSESEAWSEPDRNVSLARIGIDEKSKMKKKGDRSETSLTGTSTSDDNEFETSLKRSPSDGRRTQEKLLQMELLIAERDNQILSAQCALVECDNRLKEQKLKVHEMNQECECLKKANNAFESEIAKYKQKGGLEEELVKLNAVLEEKSRALEKVQAERDQIAVDFRVAQMELDTMRKSLKSLTEQHRHEIEQIIESEHVKIQQLESDLTKKHQDELKRREESLTKDWVSKVSFEEQRKKLLEFQNQLSETQVTIDFLRESEIEINTQLRDGEKNIRSLKKMLDDATLQASKAVLDRTKALNDKHQVEEELNIKMIKYELEANDLNTKIAQLQQQNTLLLEKQNKNAQNSDGYASEDMPLEASKQRLENSSPDLGIESDAGRATSIEVSKAQKDLLKTIELAAAQSMANLESDEANRSSDGGSPPKELPAQNHDCIKMDKENADLRHKLLRTRRAFEETYNKLRTANQRKEQAERDIRQQIMKTQNVLKNVRTNMESELEHKGKGQTNAGYKSDHK